MARARNGLIDLTTTPYYHVISRCARRVLLCGEDKWQKIGQALLCFKVLK